MSYKRIFILGAGSSIGHNAEFPSINQFFSKAKEERLYNNKSFNHLHEYIRKYFGEDIKTSETKLNIEDVLSSIDIDIERTVTPELLLIKKEALNLIRKLLIKLQQNNSIKNGQYHDLKSTIKESKADTVITFNWDIMLDDILGREEVLDSNNGKKKEKRYEQFYFKYTAISEVTLSGLSIPYENLDTVDGCYIKLHGSIDWFYCSNEACRLYNKVFPVMHPGKELNCSNCHEDANCMIVPPTINKHYRQYPIIRTLWNLASKEISRADEIVIWGYSLPPTDFYSSWLLRQARKKPLAKLTIINPEVIKKENKSSIVLDISFIKRFYDLFGDVIPKESLLLYKSYRDYNDGQDVFKKYLKGKSITDYSFL